MATNYEKYKDELVHEFMRDNSCGFIKKYIVEGECTGDCSLCEKETTEWLNKEYAEKRVNWTKVPVDTPILVGYTNGIQKLKAHFAKYDSYGVWAFADGRTSWTTDNEMFMYTRCELAREEDIKKYTTTGHE